MERYVELFASLRTQAQEGKPAPHKAILLLSMIDLIASFLLMLKMLKGIVSVRFKELLDYRDKQEQHVLCFDELNIEYTKHYKMPDYPRNSGIRVVTSEMIISGAM